MFFLRIWRILKAFKIENIFNFNFIPTVQAIIFSQPGKWRGKKGKIKSELKHEEKSQEINRSLLNKYF